jgi:hypothetical protein
VVLPALREAVRESQLVARLRPHPARVALRRPAAARELFDAYRAAIDATGEAPVTVTVSKTRIEFVTRARFAGAIIHRDWVSAHFWLKHHVDDERFAVEFLAPNNWVYRFDLRDEAQIDDVVRERLREARVVGDQRHPSQVRYRVAPTD